MTAAVAGALRAGLPAVRRAGPRGAALALSLYLPPALVAVSPWPMFSVVGLIARTWLVFALVRHLGAHRPEPPPPPPDVDEHGLRIGRPRHAVEPVGPADRQVRHALAAAGALLRPAIRLTGVQLLMLLAAPLVLLLLSGNRVAQLDEEYLVLLALPLLAIGWAFLGVVSQRIALEGDPRVLLAVAHSVRVARSCYGSLLVLNLVQPALAGIALFAIEPGQPAIRSIAVGAVLLVSSVAAQLAVTAASNEIYLAAPRLDVPAGGPD